VPLPPAGAVPFVGVGAAVLLGTTALEVVLRAGGPVGPWFAGRPLGLASVTFLCGKLPVRRLTWKEPEQACPPAPAQTRQYWLGP
jgi:hypothetical protein